MDELEETFERGSAPGPLTPTSKQRFGAQHAVARLLDALAPERPPARRDEPTTQIQRLRTPRGCILQAPHGALTVSWFPGGAVDASLGELQICAWRGMVARPGSARHAGGTGAEMVWQEVLVPVETGVNTWAWRAGDGKLFDAEVLAERCQGVLIPSARETARAS